ncbi:CAAX protease [Rhodococcus sp. 3.70]
MDTQLPDVWVEKWLSAERFGTYRRMAGGDRARALALHEWNAKLNAALLHDFAHLEVGLRNLYDRALDGVVVPGDRHWTNPKSATRLFPHIDGPDVKTHRDLSTARRLAGGPTAPAGKVMAELTFGFWVLLTSSRHDRLIWQPHLKHVFPSGTTRSLVHAGLDELRKVRNRVAHHEPVRTEVANTVVRRMHHYCRYVSPELAAYVRETSTVESLVRSRP